MTSRSPKAPRPRLLPEPPEARRWRDVAFWSLILACLAAFLVLSALDDRQLLFDLATLTTHGKVDHIENLQQIALVVEHLRWWILTLPLAALFLRWIPYTSTQSHQRDRHPDTATSGVGVSPEVSSLSTTDSDSDNETRGKAVSNRRSTVFPCPPFVVGLFALQLCIGAGFLTGTWTYIHDRFWFPIPQTTDQIRNEVLPRRALPISRRLARILPPDAKVYIVTDPGETPIFLNYYLYPRRFYASESSAGFVEQTDKPSFWAKRRKEGYRWVYIYRPQADPIGGGSLIELPPSPIKSAKQGHTTGREEGAGEP